MCVWSDPNQPLRKNFIGNLKLHPICYNSYFEKKIKCTYDILESSVFMSGDGGVCGWVGLHHGAGGCLLRGAGDGLLGKHVLHRVRAATVLLQPVLQVVEGVGEPGRVLQGGQGARDTLLDRSAAGPRYRY